MQLTKALSVCLAIAAATGIGLMVSSCSNKTAPQIIAEASADISTVPSQIAITIDDLPYVPRSKSTPKEGLRFVTSITAALQKHDITATGFAVGQQIDAQTKPALEAFAGAGHTIGNHSWSHPDYDTLTSDQFREETARTDQVLSEWIKGARYYRFPFLKEGKTDQTKSMAKRILEDLGYQNVPVTIDNDEWQFNAEYLDAIKQGNLAEATKVAHAYLAHMQERTVYFQTLARDGLGRDVDHILLIHMNRINADHLATLLDWYAAQGWTFITVAEALADPVFSRPDLYSGPRGVSQIERVLGKVSN